MIFNYLKSLPIGKRKRHKKSDNTDNLTKSHRFVKKYDPGNGCADEVGPKHHHFCYRDSPPIFIGEQFEGDHGERYTPHDKGNEPELTLKKRNPLPCADEHNAEKGAGGRGRANPEMIREW